MLLFIAAVLVFSGPATAGEEEALREEVRQLREKVDALSAQQSTLLEQEVESYLEQNSAWEGAQGGPMQGVSISARFTGVNQNTIGLDQFNRSVNSGDVDLDFDFEVTENLDLFIYLNAHTNEGAFEFQFGDSQLGGFTGGGAAVPRTFGPIAGTTVAGADDGIGVNGTVSVTGFSSAVNVYEAGIKHSVPVGDNRLHWELGKIDPRTRFHQNAFADDENTQFINNNFDDSSSVLWLSDASGRAYLGVHLWMSFGENKQFTVNGGWWNAPGQWFNQGQFYFQFSWKGEVSGREMNIRLFGFIDEFFRDATNDGSSGGGASWDWWVTDKIGVFFKIATNGGDVAVAELDASVGAQFNGLIGSRPDDILGVAVGFLTINDTVIPGIPEDTELVLELYYRYMTENGKLQITPHLMYVNNPGGNGADWFDDVLFILGVRIHVPF